MALATLRVSDSDDLLTQRHAPRKHSSVVRLVKPTNIGVSRGLERLSERRGRMSRIHGVRVIRVGHDPCARDRFRSMEGRIQREPEDPGVQYRERAADRGEGRATYESGTPLGSTTAWASSLSRPKRTSRSAARRSDRVLGVGGTPAPTRGQIIGNMGRLLMEYKDDIVRLESGGSARP
ncbi:MAG: hypothetical protein Ct9H300mP30_4920 [Methanobacteriota archaeon]|nr:MAG: hypothetical protein Ct9H300mP30_4920 [Euryarchaeota archaeon]